MLGVTWDDFSFIARQYMLLLQDCSFTSQAPRGLYERSHRNCEDGQGVTKREAILEIVANNPGCVCYVSGNLEKFEVGYQLPGTEPATFLDSSTEWLSWTYRRLVC